MVRWPSPTSSICHDRLRVLERLSAAKAVQSPEYPRQRHAPPATARDNLVASSRTIAPAVTASLDVPLFPLQTVLFPGGALPLKVFEQRYMDMAKVCIRDGLPFGVCLIDKGGEVGAPAQPFSVGTLARIAGWDMPRLGVLDVATRGVLQPVPEQYARLVPLLRVIVADLGAAAPPEPHRFFDATWVGYRYSEVLPIPNAARQKLLELDDSVARLEIIYRFLERKNLIVG